MQETFIDILEKLEKESSTNRKIEIIKENSTIPFLKWYLRTALDKNITFGIEQLPEYNKIDEPIQIDKNIIALTEKLSKRELTGKAALNEIADLLSRCKPLQEKWFRKLLQKDLASIGIGQSLYDKAYGEATKFKLGLACEVEELDKIDDDQDGYCDLKYNGYRTTIYIIDGKVDIIYSGRSGIEAENFYFIKDELERLISKLPDKFQNCVLDGEIHIGHDNHLVTTLYGFKYRPKEEFMGKKGLKEKAWSDYQAREKEVLELKSRAKFAIFDYIPMDAWEAQEYKETLFTRKATLRQINVAIEEFGIKQIEIAKSKYCKNKAEGIKAAQEYIDQGYEGGIWKVSNGCYQWKRWRTWIKIKKETTFEIQLTDFVIQKEKYNGDGTKKPDMIGKVLGLDKFGTIHEVGTGEVLDEKTRIDMFNNWDKYKGKIYQCSAQESSKVSGKYINPRLDIERLDRNSLED